MAMGRGAAWVDTLAGVAGSCGWLALDLHFPLTHAMPHVVQWTQNQKPF